MREKGPRIVSALTSKMSALMFLLQSYVVSQKLSGQVLKRRTGALSGSVHVVPTTTVGTKIVGEVTGASPPAGYGWVHELGGSRSFRVKVMSVKGRALSFMHPPLPKRPWMAPSQQEMAAQIEQALRDAVNMVIDE